jgi:serine/threonine protein kinase
MVFEHLPMSLIENYKLTKSTYSGRLGEQLIRSYIFQVALALEGMHQHHLMHRDIKPENIMVDGRTAKLIDFGLAKKNDFGKNT